jgi:hypothetical protein
VKAGRITAGFQSRRRDEYLRLRGGELLRREATLKTGADHRSSFDVRRSTLDWDQGTIRSRGKRIFRDGPIIDYSKVVSSHSVFDGVSLPMLQRALSPRFFSLVDRALIKNLHASGTVVAATVATHGR